MELKYCQRDDLKDYISFCKDVYKHDIGYRDSLTVLLKSVLYNKGEFCKNAQIMPVLVKNNEAILAACTYIVASKYNDTLQIAFFEAKENCREAIQMILDTAKEKCKAEGIKRIVIGLNGHVNYGLGFLSDHFNEAACFGSSYNPHYYIDYFSGLGMQEHILTSFLVDMKRYNLDAEKKILDRINKNFTFRIADFKNLDKEVEIYTSLNNRCFKGHPFYFERDVKEDFELLNQFKLFINGENLLIAERDNEPIGFMLWYPDFNQLIPPGKGIGLSTYIKNKIFKDKIDKFKIAEIGVVPEYQGSGVVLGLFNECMKLTKERYRWCEAGWILNSNQKSKGFGIRWADAEYKHYKVFELNLQEET